MTTFAELEAEIDRLMPKVQYSQHVPERVKASVELWKVMVDFRDTHTTPMTVEQRKKFRTTAETLLEEGLGLLPGPPQPIPEQIAAE